MLNQLPLAPSLHNRFIDHRICSSGLRDGEISLYARMAAICDVYDALTARPYKKPWTASEAISWMLDTKGVFDRDVLREFIDGVIRA